MTNFVVLLPGIMGSELTHTTKLTSGNQTTWIWSEDAVKSIINLVRYPEYFKFDPNVSIEARSIIGYLRSPMGLYHYEVYAPLIRKLQDLSGYDYIAFPYDWRRNLRETARQLADKCAELKELGGAGSTISLVGHSMGGLVITYALVAGMIGPADVAKVVTIGTPFGGSPSAFRALFYSGHLPGVNILTTLLKLSRGSRKIRKLLLDATQSFTSVYQLLPDQNFNFITVPGYGEINLLNLPGAGHLIDLNFVHEARDFHSKISNLGTFKGLNPHIKFRHILDEGGETGYRYSAEIGISSSAFENIKLKTWVDGDETVPAHFADASAPETEIVRTAGCEHMTMCANDRIVNAVSFFLG